MNIDTLKKLKAAASLEVREEGKIEITANHAHQASMELIKSLPAICDLAIFQSVEIERLKNLVRNHCKHHGGPGCCAEDISIYLEDDEWSPAHGLLQK